MTHANGFGAAEPPSGPVADQFQFQRHVNFWLIAALALSLGVWVGVAFLIRWLAA